MTVALSLSLLEYLTSFGNVIVTAILVVFFAVVWIFDGTTIACIPDFASFTKPVA